MHSTCEAHQLHLSDAYVMVHDHCASELLTQSWLLQLC
jgi:hypothetical protein